MNIKKECKIIQDLLPNYIEGLTNEQTNSFVEEHLKSCEECNEIYSNMKLEISNLLEKSSKKEIDYLKKIRIRNRIKAVFMAFVIVVLIFAGYYLYKFSIINSVGEKVSKSFESENFYVETITPTGFDDDTLAISKIWYKDGKYKKVSYIKKDDEIVQNFGAEYGDIKSNPSERYEINEEEKIARKVKLPEIMQVKKYDFAKIVNPIWPSYMDEYIKMRLGAAFYTKISTDHKEIGRKYYVFNLGESKVWIDIETGLPIMSFGYSKGVQYYKDTKIPKKTVNEICQYNYEFENVTEEDILMPDLAEYEIEFVDYEEQIKNITENANI